MIFFIDLIAATLRNATPLVYGTVGETYSERSGVLNLGIEGTMYAGAFAGFAAALGHRLPADRPGRGDRGRPGRRGDHGAPHRDARREPARLRASA